MTILHTSVLPGNNLTFPILGLKYTLGSIGITQKNLAKFVHGKSILHTVGQPGDNPINPFCGPREGHGSTGVTDKISAKSVKICSNAPQISLHRDLTRPLFWQVTTHKWYFQKIYQTQFPKKIFVEILIHGLLTHTVKKLEKRIENALGTLRTH